MSSLILGVSVVNNMKKRKRIGGEIEKSTAEHTENAEDVMDNVFKSRIYIFSLRTQRSRR